MPRKARNPAQASFVGNFGVTAQYMLVEGIDILGRDTIKAVRVRA